MYDDRPAPGGGMTRRWTVTIESIDGRVLHEERFRTCRRALAWANGRQSFLYDVWLNRAGHRTVLLYGHTPPHDWAREVLG